MHRRAVKRRRVSAPAALLCCLLLLGGCSQWRYDMGSPVPQLPTTAAAASLGEVLALLGPPQRISATDAGYVLAWEHWRIDENAIGFSLGLKGTDLLAIDWGTMRARGEFLLLAFDSQNRLASAVQSTWDSEGGSGQAVQPLFSFVDVLESADLTAGMPQHHWGASLLQPLPVMLNRGSSPDSGGAGLEQRGTPSSLGQRSLEMR